MKKSKALATIDQPPAATNTSTLVAGFISELIRIDDAIDRETEKHITPLKDNKKDIMGAAKSNNLNIPALKRAVKFKRAEGAARKAMSQELCDTDTYLSFIQLSLFPPDAS